MSQSNDLPTNNVVRAVLDVIAPTYSGFNIQPLTGSYSNHTHLVNIEFTDRPTQKIVLRRYNETNGDCSGKARREFHTLKLLQGQGFPAPRPLYLDDTGNLLGSPGIMTEFVDGEQIDIDTEPHNWGNKIDVVAQMLARIHATPFDDSTRQHLMNGNIEAAWFVKSGTIPDYVKQHPDGVMVWKTVAERLPQIRPVEPVLLHLDYWSGNILWDKGQISAVVDWEEAAYGDPAIDIAYCRMELYLQGLDEAAERFLRTYEKAAGNPVAHLGLWELAASVRTMLNLDEWFTKPAIGERFRRFIAHAKGRAANDFRA